MMTKYSSPLFLEENYKKDLTQILMELHEEIRSTRGTVAAISLLDLKTGVVKYVGLGNTVARKFGTTSKRFLSRDGVLGYIIPTPREEMQTLDSGDVLVFYTDGVQEHFELDDYPDLLKDSPDTIVYNIMEKFGKEHDDAACIALKYGGSCD